MSFLIRALVRAIEHQHSCACTFDLDHRHTLQQNTFIFLQLSIIYVYINIATQLELHHKCVLICLIYAVPTISTSTKGGEADKVDLVCKINMFFQIMILFISIVISFSFDLEFDFKQLEKQTTNVTQHIASIQNNLYFCKKTRLHTKPISLVVLYFHKC